MFLFFSKQFINNFDKKALINFIIYSFFGLISVFTLNLLFGGSLLSTSMLVKSSGFSLSNINFQIFTYNFFVTFIIYLLIIIYSIFKKDNLLIVFSSITMIFFSYVFVIRLLANANFGFWYDTVHLIFGGISLILIFIKELKFNKFRHYRKKSYLFLNYFILYTFLIQLVPIKLSLQRFNILDIELIESDLKKFSETVSSITNKNEIISSDDYPGFFTYFTNKKIIPLDGLANSTDFIKNYLYKGNIAEYLKIKKCSYLITYNNLIKRKSDSLFVVDIGFRFNKSIPLSYLYFNPNQIKYQSSYFSLIELKEN